MKKADHQLAQRVLDGEVDAADFAAFQDRLRAEPELADLYRQYALLHHSLAEEHEGGFPTAEVGRTIARVRLRKRVWVTSAVAVLTAAAIWLLRPWLFHTDPPDLAVATFSVDAVPVIDGPFRNLGGATGLRQGARLRLEQGRAEIAFNPSLSAVVEGPALLTFPNPQTLRVESGKAWLRAGGAGGLTVDTPLARATPVDAEFGVIVGPQSHAEEWHVANGWVQISDATGNQTPRSVGPESAVAVIGGTSGSGGWIMSRATEFDRFAQSLGRFHPLVGGDFDKAQWRVAHGNPQFSATSIEGENFAVFLPLGPPRPDGSDTILLATLEVGRPHGAEFHTDGWSGMSFYSGGTEVLFFGDSFGSQDGWSLDVKQRVPIILPAEPVIGPRTVTLRYDVVSGDVSLHDGAPPLRPALCAGKLPPGTRFDEVRLGASAGAALTVNRLHIRAGGG